MKYDKEEFCQILSKKLKLLKNNVLSN